uniref:Transcriptional regulatory protein n=1 Tax=Oryza nivara TaxID=4536 RepID=A0A0E0ITM0_ORYNI
MASAARALGALVHKASSLSSSVSALRSAAVLHGRGSAGGSARLFQRHAARRRISTFQPLCMGRRSCKIAGRKDAQNLKKMKRNSKIGKEIVAAIKKGGPSPSSNTTLAAILEKARELDIPKEILERNIKRASEKGQDTYTEKVYEVYGFGGVGMVVEVLTDKITRSIADIRNVVKDCGAKLADPGSVTFRFRQARVVNIKIVTTSENYPVVLSKLQEEGLKFETDNGYELLPLNPIEVDDEAMELNKVLVSKLLELDDVDAVYTDQR